MSSWLGTIPSFQTKLGYVEPHLLSLATVKQDQQWDHYQQIDHRVLIVHLLPHTVLLGNYMLHLYPHMYYIQLAGSEEKWFLC